MNFTTADILKMFASFIIGTVGFFMLLRGKKISDVKLMVWGAILLVASYFLF